MCHTTLPENYIEHDKIDLMHNKKQFWIVQLLGIIITVVMLVGGYFICPAVYNDSSYWNVIALVVLIIGYILYIILHEATHGVVMRLSVKAKLNFGFKGWAAYAGSTGYFDKKHYIVISLAPLVLWGIVFAVLNIFFHTDVWFAVIWVLQIGNIAGASGDLFCTYKMLRYPKDILVLDTGTEMTVYRRMTEEEIEEAENLKIAGQDNEPDNEVLQVD